MSSPDPSTFAQRRVTFIGAGNMGGALIGGLVRAGHTPKAITACDAAAEPPARLAAVLGIIGSTDASAAVADADVVVLAVKPDQVRAALDAIAEPLRARSAAVVSVAAGVDCASLANWLGRSEGVYRAMPNTPALVGAGITGVYSADADAGRRATVDYVLAATGETAWLPDEGLFDAVTALSGSGPAYVFALAEAMRQAGEQLGLEPALANRLARATVAGAGKLLGEADVDAGELRDRVTSKGGTTAAALETLAHGGFDALVLSAMRAAAKRSAELQRT